MRPIKVCDKRIEVEGFSITGN